jgi:hypothetical protein
MENDGFEKHLGYAPFAQKEKAVLIRLSRFYKIQKLNISQQVRGDTSNVRHTEVSGYSRHASAKMLMPIEENDLK